MLWFENVKKTFLCESKNRRKLKSKDLYKKDMNKRKKQGIEYIDKITTWTPYVMLTNQELTGI